MTRAMTTAMLPLFLLASSLGAGTVDPERPAGTITDHVLVISIDGLRPDAIDEYGLETLQRLQREGSSAAEARTILPSKTLPSHTSMLTGVPPSVHGITFNRSIAAEENVQVPTMFELARADGFHTAAFFSKAKLRHLQRPDAFDYWQAPESNVDHWMATRTVGDAVQYLAHERPNLMFVHIGEPDYAGHTMGWMGMIYGMATKRADAAVARILDAAEEAFGAGNYTVIVTADHGGHGRDHGSEHTDDVHIPWMIWGEGVAQGSAPASVRTMDTAATALWLLGVNRPTQWAGMPVQGAFTSRALAAAEAAGDTPVVSTAETAEADLVAEPVVAGATQ